MAETRGLGSRACTTAVLLTGEHIEASSANPTMENARLWPVNSCNNTINTENEGKQREMSGRPGRSRKQAARSSEKR